MPANAGIHCLTPEYASRMLADGFDIVTLGSDVRFLAGAVGSAVAAIRG